MKILVVSPFFPSASSSGACTRSYYLLKALTREYTVSLLILADLNHEQDVVPEGLKLQHLVMVPKKRRHKRIHQALCMLRGKSSILEEHRVEGVQQALDTLFTKEHYDIVLFESALMAADYQLPRCARIVIDEHDIEYELLYRTYVREGSFARKWYNWWESRQIKAFELDRCSNADGVLVTSEREALLLKSMLPTRMIAVVPNGVDTEAFQWTDQGQELADRIVFTGSMEHYPNIDAVLYFSRECWPLIRLKAPRATWQIVGRSPPPSVLELGKLPGISVIGTVPDVKPYLAAATVAIVPLLIGSGTRLKILEALAMGKAVVSSALGCEGLSVVSGKHLIIADEPAMFAQAVLDLLRNPHQRAALRAAGRGFVEAHSWQRCGDALVRAVEKIARGSASDCWAGRDRGALGQYTC